MKNFIIITLIGVLIFFGGLFLIKNKNNSHNIPEKNIKLLKSINDNSEKTNQYKKIEDSQGKVTIEVEPINLGTDLAKNIFRIKLNTHSVDLDYDFKNIVFISDDLGNRYNVLVWTGGRGGHHLNGNVEFESINKKAKRIKMTIKGVDNIDRYFEWEIN